MRRALEYVRQRDPVGDRVHLVMAMLYIGLLPVATAPSTIASLVLFVYALIRLPNTWRAFVPVVRAPIVRTAAAWFAWTALALAWSETRAQGMDEVLTLRMLALPLVLWPVVHSIERLVGAALVGVAVLQGVQLLQGLDLIPVPSVVEGTGRLSGGLHPIQAGAWCVAAILWHLPRMLIATPRIAIVALIGAILAGLGLIATQSRGPWLAGAVVVPLAVVILAIRFPTVRRRAILLIVAGVLAGGGAWIGGRSIIAPRVETAVEEFRAAWSDGHYDSDVGLRVGMWRWGREIWREHPIVGGGTGAFRSEQRQRPSWQALVAQDPSSEARLGRDHAHNTILHVLATSGLVGAALLVAFLLVVLAASWADPRGSAARMGAPFVILSWLIGAQFDCYHLNAHLLGLLMLAVTVVMARGVGDGEGEESGERGAG